MAPDLEDRVPREILEALIQEGTEAFRKVLEKLLNLAMGLERSEFLGAEPYERTSQRRGHANGYKDKKIATRVGELRLKIPQVRGLSFYPQSLEKGCRSEKALKLAIAEMYVMGVSTRKVSEITEQLCGTEISASQVSRVASLLDEELEKFRSRPLGGEYPFVYLDAHYEKVRVDGRVQDLAILKAVGVQTSGHREVLGLSARLSEAEVHWRAFFEDLASRGLKGMELVVSDDHAGLKAARRAVFPAVPWQRCQFHLSQNAQRFARRLQERGQIGQAMRDIFNSPTLEDAEAMLKRKIKAFTETNQALAQWMEDNVREGLTVYAFPRSLHKKIRTNNGVENLNKQIRRRTRVVGIFPPYRLGVATDLSRAGGDSRRVAHGPLLSEPGELARRGGILEERFPKPQTLRSARVLGKGQPAIVAVRASDRASFLEKRGRGPESLSPTGWLRVVQGCSGLSF